MKTIFQTGFRPANPFEAGFNHFGSIRLGQYEDEGWTSEAESGYFWPEEVPYPTTYEQPPYQQPTYTSEEPMLTEDDEFRQLQQHGTTPTQTTTTPSTAEQIIKGVATGAAAGAKAFNDAQQQAAARPGAPTAVPGAAPGTTLGMDTSTLAVAGVGVLALVVLVAVIS